jgi:hypothetical protein
MSEIEKKDAAYLAMFSANSGYELPVRITTNKKNEMLIY